MIGITIEDETNCLALSSCTRHFPTTSVMTSVGVMPDSIPSLCIDQSFIETEDLLKKLQPAPLLVTFGKTPSQTFGMKLSSFIIYLRTF